MNGLRAAPVSDPSYLKGCCADLWAHPGIRLLVGDSLHPGGLALTERALDGLALPEGARILDLGSGPGATVGAARGRGLRAVGLDLVAHPGVGAGGFVRGDAERLPFRDGAFDGAIAECVVSALPDKAAAAAELRRVVRPGGRVALADVTLEGELPAPLATFLGWIACVAGAMRAEDHAALLAAAGFTVRSTEDHTPALEEMVSRARRRLALLQGAVRAGLGEGTSAGLPGELLDLGQELLAQAHRAVREGALGYVLVVGD